MARIKPTRTKITPMAPAPSKMALPNSLMSPKGEAVVRVGRARVGVGVGCAKAAVGLDTAGVYVSAIAIVGGRVGDIVAVGVSVGTLFTILI